MLVQETTNLRNFYKKVEIRKNGLNHEILNVLKTKI